MLNKVNAFIFLVLSLINGCSSQMLQPSTPPQRQQTIQQNDVPELVATVQASYYTNYTDAALMADSRGLPIVSLAPIPDSGAVIIPMRQGQPTPVAGILLNGIAAAQIEVSVRTLAARAEVRRTTDLAELAAHALADIATLQTTISTQSTTNQIMLSSRDRELDQVYKTLTQQRNSSTIITVLVGVGVFAAGALIGAGIYAISHP